MLGTLAITLTLWGSAMSGLFSLRTSLICLAATYVLGIITLFLIPRDLKWSDFR